MFMRFPRKFLSALGLLMRAEVIVLIVGSCGGLVGMGCLHVPLGGGGVLGGWHRVVLLKTYVRTWLTL
jgi:hypothetical protein